VCSAYESLTNLRNGISLINEKKYSSLVVDKEYNRKICGSSSLNSLFFWFIDLPNITLVA